MYNSMGSITQNIDGNEIFNKILAMDIIMDIIFYIGSQMII